MIRTANRDDIPSLVEMINDLAKFEKSLHEVEIDESMLHRALFADEPSAFVLLAENDDRVVGMALYFRTFSTWTGRIGIYLEDLYVRPEFRGRGIGTDLLRAVAKETVRSGGARFEWAVLDWNTRAIAVYQSIGAVAMDEWTRYRLAGDALLRFADGNSTASA